MGAPDADLESYSPCLWVDIRGLILFSVRVMDYNDTMAFWLSYWNIQVLILSGDPQSLPISSVGHGLGLGSGQPRPWQSLPKLQLVVSVRHWWREWTRGRGDQCCHGDTQWPTSMFLLIFKYCQITLLFEMSRRRIGGGGDRKRKVNPRSAAE